MPTGKETRPKPREVAIQKYEYYAKYEVEHIPGITQRNLVDDIAHDAMQCAPKKWQDEDATRHDLERPSWTDWYWDLRCELIDAGLLKRRHGWDVCRSYLKGEVQKKLTAAALEVKR